MSTEREHDEAHDDDAAVPVQRHRTALQRYSLHALLDKQDRGEPLTEDEQAEAEGLVNLADLLSLIRLRASSQGSPASYRT